MAEEHDAIPAEFEGYGAINAAVQMIGRRGTVHAPRAEAFREFATT